MKHAIHVHRTIGVALLFTALLLFATVASWAQELRAGYAKVDITPCATHLRTESTGATDCTHAPWFSKLPASAWPLLRLT